MSFENLVECELQRTDWSKVIDANGPATSLPDALRALLRAQTPEEADSAYWKIENRAFVQNSLFEASVPFVSALIAALCDSTRSNLVRGYLLEILFHLVDGESHKEEVARGFPHLGEQCRSRAREGLWLIYQFYQERTLWQHAYDIINIIDQDTNRLKILRELNAKDGRQDIFEKVALPPDSLRP